LLVLAENHYRGLLYTGAQLVIAFNFLIKPNR
jgi:hypothetical protein